MSKTKQALEELLKSVEKDNGSKLEGIVDDVIAILIDHLSLDIALAIDDCQSPIEKAFSLYFNRYINLSVFGRGISEVFECTNQAPINIEDKNYRVDFLVEYANQKTSYAQQFVIECDGHDFHEKTKEQAANDRQRERKLIQQGFIVIRFTGSEIYNAPAKCAREALRIIENVIKRNNK